MTHKIRVRVKWELGYTILVIIVEVKVYYFNLIFPQYSGQLPVCR